VATRADNLAYLKIELKCGPQTIVSNGGVVRTYTEWFWNRIRENLEETVSTMYAKQVELNVNVDGPLPHRWCNICKVSATCNCVEKIGQALQKVFKRTYRMRKAEVNRK
jgi:hypothetical protein